MRSKRVSADAELVLQAMRQCSNCPAVAFFTRAGEVSEVPPPSSFNIQLEVARFEGHRSGRITSYTAPGHVLDLARLALTQRAIRTYFNQGNFKSSSKSTPSSS